MNILIEMDLAGSKYHGMAFRCYQFAVEFLKRGHQVMIVAASYSHVRFKNPTVKNEITNEVIDGIIYKWIKTPQYKGNGLKRVFHMLVYNIKLFIYSNKIAKEFNPNIVISSGVTPFEIFGCRRIAQKSRAKLIYEVGDLWPLTPKELGGFSKWHPFIMAMQYAENFAYKNCDATVSLLPCAENYMSQHGLAKGKFNCIPNGIVIDDWKDNPDLSEPHNTLLRKLRDEKKIIIGYAGAHGIANSLYSAIDAVAGLESSNCSFVMVGSGPEKRKLEEYVKSKKYNNIYFLPPVNKPLIPSLLQYMDILYIGLQRQSLFRFGISPNKLFDYMMAAKPVVQAIDAGNNIVKNAQCGFYAEPDNIDDIRSAILKLVKMKPEERNKLGENGKLYALQNHTYDVLAENYIGIMKSI